MTTIKEEHGNVTVWWFPKDFSQARFGAFQRSGTNSCTLISLILADKIAREQNGFHNSFGQLPNRAIEIFATAINQGNQVYSQAFSRPNATRPEQNLNINIPDAMRALQNQSYIDFHLHEWFFTHLQSDPNKDAYTYIVAQRLEHVLRLGMRVFRQPINKLTTPQFLFAAVIADSRTVVFTFELRMHMITFFDSHQHGRGMGAIIAQSNFENLLELTTWFINMLRTVYSSRPKLFEVSFLTREPINMPSPSYSNHSMDF